MNYIKQLQRENAVLREGYDDLMRYLSLPKFAGEGNNFVNPDDIRLRIYEIKQRCDDHEWMPITINYEASDDKAGQDKRERH